MLPLSVLSKARDPAWPKLQTICNHIQHLRSYRIAEPGVTNHLPTWRIAICGRWNELGLRATERCRPESDMVPTSSISGRLLGRTRRAETISGVPANCDDRNSARDQRRPARRRHSVAAIRTWCIHWLYSRFVAYSSLTLRAQNSSFSTSS